jgi:class 3 adenylate cyclase
LFTDIAGSTARAANMGDQAWKVLLDGHNDLVRRQLTRYRGNEVKTTGDGFLATFDGPARAIRCADAIREGARRLGLDIRAGVHTGEIEVRGTDVAGIAVHIASRVASCAQPGQVLVSHAVPPLVVGAGIEFAEVGQRDLKGVPGDWTLFAVTG